MVPDINSSIGVVSDRYCQEGPSRGAGRVLRVLNIDDDPGCLMATARFLTFVGGHIVEAAESAAEGIGKALSLRPDAILLDLNLPDASGIEVLEHLEEDARTCGIPVILVTGEDLTENQRDRLLSRKNFVTVLEKPSSLQRLLGIVEAVSRQGRSRPRLGRCGNADTNS